MELLFDAKEYLRDWRWFGYPAIALLALFFFFFDIFLLIFASGVVIRTGSDFVFLCGSNILIIFLYGLLIYMYGGLDNSKLRIYDSGIEYTIDDLRGKTEFMPYDEIMEIEFFVETWYRYANRWSKIRTIYGKEINTQVDFLSKPKLDAFGSRVLPIFTKNGFKLAEKEEGDRRLRLRFSKS